MPSRMYGKKYGMKRITSKRAAGVSTSGRAKKYASTSRPAKGMKYNTNYAKTPSQMKPKKRSMSYKKGK